MRERKVSHRDLHSDTNHSPSRFRTRRLIASSIYNDDSGGATYSTAVSAPLPLSDSTGNHETPPKTILARRLLSEPICAPPLAILHLRSKGDRLPLPLPDLR